MARIKSSEICQKICSLLRQLSSGWRQPKREINLGVVDDISSQLLELYKVNESLYLVWTIDIIKDNSNYVQVLKIWDVLPLSEVTNLAKNIDISYRSYSADILRCCKTRCYDGYNSYTLISFTWLKIVEILFQIESLTYWLLQEIWHSRDMAC